jgi:hypothetical protein
VRQPRPLPRSLVPLPGESLPGFVLRLSFRLNQPPARITELTGLAMDGPGGARLPVILLAGVPEAARSEFTRMTRLTGDQADRLGASAWQARYGPVIAAERHARGGHRLNGQVILAPATRYCPECLAGDGSAIQQALGGAWLRAWHLPVVFACPAHQRLLEHLCPECGQAVRGRRPGGYAAILPAMRVAGLHPAQCRTEVTPGNGRSLPACCGARLDLASRHRPASARLITIQAKILALLDPEGPDSTLSAGLPTSPPGYFADLRALQFLACSTWPAARHLSPSEEASAAIDQHVGSLRQQASDRQAASPGTAARARFDFPSADAAASAGLAHIADSILAGSPGEAREQLGPLLPAAIRQAGRTPWARWVARAAPPCSNGLQAAASPLLRRFTRAAGRPEGRRNAVLGSPRWTPEHIPAFLPEDWLARHFTPITDVNPMLIRRTAALRLVQMAAGGSLGEAAGFLGIAATGTTWERKGRIYAGAGHVHARSRQQPGPGGFEDALAALARELDDPATPLVNYQRRRQALREWCIDQDAWASLAGRLPRAPGPPPEVGDRKRQIASLYAWTLVTSGEHHFAPRPIEAAQPREVQEAWALRRNTIWHLMHRSKPGPHYASLKAELATMAISLARAIDARD